MKITRKKHKMFSLRNLAWMAMPILLILLLQVAVTRGSPIKIVNVHESIESAENIASLREAMESLNIKTTALSGIPEDLLHFKGANISLVDSAKNNPIIENAIKEYPDEFYYICQIDPLNVNRLEELETCITNGAVGVKLYNGYGYSHVLPIDAPRLSDFYQTIADVGKILMLPVNTAEYQSELENMLTLNPTLKVICPHYCLASKDLPRLTALMDTHENLYVDTSFGSQEFADEGFQTIANNLAEFKDFFNRFQDRILFGTDTVVTTFENKDAEFLKDLYGRYISILTDKEALDLPYGIKQKVFWQNWQDLLK